MMLEAFDIKYMTHTTIKGQVLTNLVAEFIEECTKDKMLGFEIMVVSTSSFLA